MKREDTKMITLSRYLFRTFLITMPVCLLICGPILTILSNDKPEFGDFIRTSIGTAVLGAVLGVFISFTSYTRFLRCKNS